MTPAVAVSLAMLFITVVVGFSRLLKSLGRIELKMDLMWEWYLKNHSDVLPGGKRHTDPPAV